MTTDEVLAKLSEDEWRSHVILAMEMLHARMAAVEQEMREASAELHRLLAMRLYVGSETLQEAADRLNA